MPGETSQANRGDSLIIGSRRFGSPLTRDNPEVGIVTKRMPAQIDGLTVRLETNSPTSGFQVVLLDLAGVVGQGSRRVGKDPLSR